MPLLSTRTRPAIAAAVATIALLAAGCGGDSGDNSNPGSTGIPSDTGSKSPAADDADADAATGVPQETGFVGVTETDAEPQQGGTLTMGVFGEARGLDPAIFGTSGSLGGSEMTAIYGALMRYDPAAGEYEPMMAKSLKHSDDYATWTLTLREGVEFSDGTPLNGAAVVAHVNRARKGTAALLVNQITSMDTPDEHTVVFHLKKPWTRFPYLLSIGPGHITSPTAVQKYGKDFGKHAIGAGPFVLDHFSPGEELVVTANENYWGEGPYLDEIRFVPLRGAPAKLDSLESGDIQAAYMRDAPVIAETRKAGYGGFVNVTSSALVFEINNAEGRPGHDPRVRKAIAYAINSDLLNRRAYEGKGLIQKEIIAASSQWATEAQATPYDSEKAKALLAEAKADGYDGKITITDNPSGTGEAVALALQAQLNAVGFDASLDQEPNITAVARKIIGGKYDASAFGLSINDAAPWHGLNNLVTGSPSNYAHYSNPEMDALVGQLHDATTETERQQAINEIQKLWTETVPLVPLAAIPAFVAWDDSVHGVVPTSRAMVSFAQAWLSD